MAWSSHQKIALTSTRWVPPGRSGKSEAASWSAEQKCDAWDLLSGGFSRCPSSGLVRTEGDDTGTVPCKRSGFHPPPKSPLGAEWIQPFTESSGKMATEDGAGTRPKRRAYLTTVLGVNTSSVCSAVLGTSPAVRHELDCYLDPMSRRADPCQYQLSIFYIADRAK